MPVQIPQPKERSLYLPTQVTQASMNDLTKNIISINESDTEIQKLGEIYGMSYKPDPIKIYIDSYGGELYACLGLIGIMERSLTQVHTIVTGCAMSCGFIIAITGHKRLCYDHSTFLYHQLSYGHYGKVKDHEDEMVESKRLQALIEKHTLHYTKLTKEQLKDSYERKTDWFISSKDALKFGIVDEII
jgi:ATP-dependent Clp protease protease subunit